MTSSASEPPVDSAPFDLPGEGPVAALCLHGLTGTPYEIRPVAEALARRGVRARGPVLPGHNETPRELARVAHTEWLAVAQAELDELRAQHQRVFVVGLSMGGLVSLDLASRNPVDAVVSIGAPLRLKNPATRLIPLLKYLFPMMRKRGGSDIRDDAARARHPGYDVMPLSAVHELLRLQARVRTRLADITAPILVAHGALDRTANPEDAREIHATVGSEERALRFFESSGHVVPVDVDGLRLSEAVADFLGRHS